MNYKQAAHDGSHFQNTWVNKYRDWFGLAIFNLSIKSMQKLRRMFVLAP